MKAKLATESDSLRLYGFRVEVICPKRQRILCGAKDGDYFSQAKASQSLH
ncbi:hypothetical protein WOLCODRAFT_68332 [Wolfiporia cocos MD-104 SS10]|uniref:Uncharacterized protein n=1 Tax=Wolfiporia cocos (strain MD-104) TaxID=742152 RepID=A0A2H3JPV3_WOLCO|nr:hypothetical protein WOLCODRAFT_68332 [Wolfiporia cocos MD-104 SS10]